MTTDYNRCPMPGERINDGIVIASVHYREPDDEPWEFTIIVLNPQPPYYTVMIVKRSTPETALGWHVIDSVDHVNIVHAVTGDPNVDPAKHKLGYGDMGGDI